MSDFQAEWDDEELVSFDELRPSRKAFGPLPEDHKRQAQRPRRPGPTPDPNGPRRRNPKSRTAQGGGRPQPQGENVRRRPPQDGERSPRPRQERRPQQAETSRPRRPREEGSQPQPQRERQQRPARSQNARAAAPARPRDGQQRRSRSQDQFANDLAARDRQDATTAANTGWRGAVRKVTGGVINLSPGSHEQAEIDARSKVRRPVTDGTVAVFSRKGGVGKTTISAYLGLTLATERGGRIVALDGDAEAGSLGWLLAPESPATLASLAAADPTPTDYRELRRYTTTTPEGLEVIVGDPAEDGPISATGLEAVAGQLSSHYDLSIFDTGAGVTRATGRVLVTQARTLLLVMSPSVDSVRAAERTLAWLDERPGEALKEGARVIAVINGIPDTAKRGHIERIESHFAERCSAVCRIPWDPYLAAGSSTVSLEQLNRETREAFLGLAATTVSTLARRPARRRAMAGTGARRAS